MKTALWLFAQFEKAALDIGDLERVFGLKAKTIRNRISAGTFPKPNAYDRWLLEDVAAELERTKAVPDATKAA